MATADKILAECRAFRPDLDITFGMLTESDGSHRTTVTFTCGGPCGGTTVTQRVATYRKGKGFCQTCTAQRIGDEKRAASVARAAAMWPDEAMVEGIPAEGPSGTRWATVDGVCSTCGAPFTGVRTSNLLLSRGSSPCRSCAKYGYDTHHPDGGWLYLGAQIPDLPWLFGYGITNDPIKRFRAHRRNGVNLIADIFHHPDAMVAASVEGQVMSTLTGGKCSMWDDARPSGFITEVYFTTQHDQAIAMAETAGMTRGR